MIPQPPTLDRIRDSMHAAIWAFFAGLAIVVLGISFGLFVMPISDGPRSPSHVPASGNGLMDTLTRWDGQWYLEIVEQGYTYRPDRRSNVAFFPAYPMCITAICRLTGAPPCFVAISVSLAFLFASMAVLHYYARKRFPAAAPKLAGLVLLSMTVFPTTIFFRMTYAESCFFFVTVSALLAMECRWPLSVVAAIIALATASRPVGVALIPVFWLHVWQRFPNWRGAVLRWIAFTPIALAGLIAYMGYQYSAFGDALAFAKTQEHWRKIGHSSTGEELLALLSHEPIWSVYLSDSRAYWRRLEPGPSAATNLAFANPIYFLLAITLVMLGAWKGWLNSRETLLAALLIFIPYIMRGHEMCMLSQGRFMAVVFPIYLVMGQVLSRIPSPYAAMVVGLFVFYLAIYSMHVAAGYPLI